jgi:hypothetical protein
VGARLFGPDADAAFQRSIGGMIWPRGFVAAGAFWHLDSGTDPSSPAFVESIYKLNDALQARNLSTCPTNCSCNQVSYFMIRTEPVTEITLIFCSLRVYLLYY